MKTFLDHLPLLIHNNSKSLCYVFIMAVFIHNLKYNIYPSVKFVSNFFLIFQNFYHILLFTMLGLNSLGSKHWGKVTKREVSLWKAKREKLRLAWKALDYAIDVTGSWQTKQGAREQRLPIGGLSRRTEMARI